TPVLVADILPGDPARCSGCGFGSDPWPRTQLWAVKGHHPNHHDGDVRFYCAEHVPVYEAPAPPALNPRSRHGGPHRAPPPSASRGARRPSSGHAPSVRTASSRSRPPACAACAGRPSRRPDLLPFARGSASRGLPPVGLYATLKDAAAIV